LKPLQKIYHSNGKLLLTGEYLVLKGALSLAVPTVYGQDMQVDSIPEKLVRWTSYDLNQDSWFAKEFKLPLDTTSIRNDTEQLLLQLLQYAQKHNPNLFSSNKGYTISTHLDFPAYWGLGTSSTLINNIAQWAQIDAYDLLLHTLGGSGYDVACAQHDKPIIYQLKEGKPLMREVDFYPDFSDQLYFVYLNKKQVTRQEIKRFYKGEQDWSVEIQAVSAITRELIHCTAMDDFGKLLYEHERILSIVLNRPTVQKALFQDYFGQIKSLGAWGGDFILATGNEDTPSYFKKRGYNTVLLYDEILL